MDNYPFPRLMPLPENRVAAHTLRRLPGIESRLPIGWALVGLTLATVITTGRPGCRLELRRKNSSLRFYATGGTFVRIGDDPTESPTSAWANGLAHRVCEICGRPGRLHPKRSATYCDTCLALERFDMKTFPAPRLPIEEQANTAHQELASHPEYGRVPDGWAPQALATIRELASVAPDVMVRFQSWGEHLKVVPVGGTTNGRFTVVAKRLQFSTRTHCLYCGRVVRQFKPQGVCAGCVSVRARGWEILPAFGDDLLP